MYWIVDPGHAWLKVKLSELIKLGISEKISGYSYKRGNYAYLEEDCDAHTYLQASGKDASKIKCMHSNKESRVRGYLGYWS